MRNDSLFHGDKTTTAPRCQMARVRVHRTIHEFRGTFGQSTRRARVISNASKVCRQKRWSCPSRWLSQSLPPCYWYVYECRGVLRGSEDGSSTQRLLISTFNFDHVLCGVCHAFRSLAAPLPNTDMFCIILIGHLAIPHTD